MRYEPQRVRLSQIDREGQTYRITTLEDIPGLAASLDRVGLINPPILLSAAEHDTYEIVSGFRRVAAADHLKWVAVPARIVSSSTSRLDCSQVAITENTSQRGLNPIESSRALCLLAASGCHDPDRLAQVAGSLGLPDSSPRLIGKLMPLCRLPQAVQDGILSGIIPLQTAMMLADLGEDTANWFADTFLRLRMGLNKQREVITLAREIALRDDLPLTAVLTEASVRTLLEDPNLDRVRKTAAFRRYLKQRRFPTLSAATEAFESILKSLRLGPNARLAPPPDFEGNTYSLTLTFSDPGGLERHRDTIERILSCPDLFQSR